MKFRFFLLVGLAALLTVISVTAVQAEGQAGLAEVRAATARFHRVEAAEAAGWVQLEGLDYCFQKPGVGAMGFHYINPALLDTVLDPLTPEAMVYAPGPDGQLMLGAVEYIVPAAAWDASENEGLPVLLGQEFHLNEALGVYVLHAWIFKNNQTGIFEDWNPTVVCP